MRPIREFFGTYASQSIIRDVNKNRQLIHWGASEAKKIEPVSDSKYDQVMANNIMQAVLEKGIEKNETLQNLNKKELVTTKLE